MLSVYTLEQCQEWDTVVRSFADYDVYYLSGYVKAFQLHGDGEPLLFYYDDHNVRGIHAVMKRDIGKDPNFSGKMKENQYFDFSTPYGYGGWLIEGERPEPVFDSYRRWCERNFIVSEFVRFHPVLKNERGCLETYEVEALGETVAMDLSSPETIWGNLTSKNRNMVRKARKNGVRIYNGRYPLVYQQFREIYNATMDKDNADQYYYFEPEFYSSILEDLPQNAQVFYAQTADGSIIAAAIMLTANGRMNYHLSGSLKEYSNMAATNLLLYEAALWGCANGYGTLYLGGGVGSKEDSLFGFKKSFYKGDFYRFHIGKKIFIPSIYEELVNQRAESNNKSFFPAYRV